MQAQASLHGAGNISRPGIGDASDRWFLMAMRSSPTTSSAVDLQSILAAPMGPIRVLRAERHPCCCMPPVPGFVRKAGLRVSEAEFCVREYRPRRAAVRARRYVVAGGVLENARPLLASNEEGALAVLGNAHDNVGRFYLTHLLRFCTRTVTGHRSCFLLRVRAATPRAFIAVAVFGLRPKPKPASGKC